MPFVAAGAGPWVAALIEENNKHMKKESPKMVKKEVEFMKKKGAPKEMIKHEKEEARQAAKPRKK